MDGAGIASVEVAIGKARTSALTRRPSKFFEDRVKDRPAFVSFPAGVLIQGAYRSCIRMSASAPLACRACSRMKTSRSRKSASARWDSVRPRPSFADERAGSATGAIHSTAFTGRPLWKSGSHERRAEE